MRSSAVSLIAGVVAICTATAGASARAAPDAGPSALKRTVAVYQFQNSDMLSGGSATDDGLTAMLTDALMRDGRFVVVERDDLANIATEQQLGAQGSTTAGTAAAAGHMIGASLIIRGSVTKFEPNAGASSFSIGGFGLGGGSNDGGLGVKGGHAVIDIALRVIDSTTGQVLATVKAEGTAGTHQVDISATGPGGLNAGGSNLATTPLGQAAEDAIEKAVPKIALAAEKAPWTAAVIETDGATVYVNAGAEENLQPGTVLAVIRKTKDLVDPATGVVLDTLTANVGTIRIDSVRPKVSTAVIVDGGPPARGDLLEVK